MKKIKIFPLLLLLALLFTAAAPAAWAEDPPILDGQAALVVDLDSGNILYELNKDQQRAPASLTKIMTTLLALEALEAGRVSLDDKVTAQDDCRQGMDESSSTAGITPGIVVSFRELLYVTMVGSANEACNVIGSYLAGSVDAFVEQMNARAAQLGCLQTHFVTTNGLPADGHVSTAWDLYLITREAMNHPLFMELANTDSYEPESIDVNGGAVMYNSNALLTPYGHYGAGYEYAYASGVKTGFTQAAGYCLISTAEKEGVHVLAVVMGCKGLLNAQINEYRNFSDTIHLYDWVFRNFSYQNVLAASETVTKVPVEFAQDNGQVILHAIQDVSLLLPNDIDLAQRETVVTLYEQKLRAPIEKDTVLGEAHIYVAGRDYGTVKLVNAVPVELARGQYMLQQLRSVFSRGWVIALIAVLLVFFLAYLVLVTRYRRLRRKHLRERRLAEQRRQAQREALRKAEEDAAELNGQWKDLY